MSTQQKTQIISTVTPQQLMEKLIRDGVIDELLEETDELLDEIDALVEEEERARYKEMLKGWAFRQGRLRPRRWRDCSGREMYLTRQQMLNSVPCCEDC